MGVVLIVVFVVMLFLGVPVFLAMGISAFAAFLQNGRIALTQVPQQVFFGINSFPIMAIPLFILASDIMTDGKLTDILIKFCDDSLGHIKGGLGHVNVVISMIFGGISGSAVADAAGPSKVVMFMMRNAGYDPYYAGALTAASSVIGVIIPPSIPMVIYALSDGKTSTMGMFAAGYIPGVLIGLSLIVVNIIESRRKNYQFRLKKLGFVARLKSAWKALPGLFMPALIIVCTVGGITTPTEAAALAVAYALFVGFFVTKKLTLKRIPTLFLGSAVVSSSILMIVAMGSLFSWVLTYARIPQAIAAWIGTLTTSPVPLLLLIALLVIITGMFVDTIPAVMILAPIVSSIAAGAGINPYQVALVVVVGIGIGMLSPPVAPLMFITSSIGNLRLEKLIKTTLPLIFAEVMILLLIIFVSPVTTWLPRILGYGG
jgi:tripartite ATP-independent transporter DctM subunit